MTARAAAACLVLMAVAVLVLYTLGLEHTPPHLHRDEVLFAVQAQSIVSTGRDIEGRAFPVYFEMRALGEHVWFHPALVYLTALFLTVLPFTEWVVRLPSAVIGVIDVVLLYFIARRLFHGERWAMFVAGLLALTPAHVIHSRLAMDFIYPVPFVMAWLLSLLIYVERRSLAWLFLATTFLGLGFFSYIASVITMPLYVVVTLVGLRAPSTTLFTKSWRPYLVAAAGFLWPLLVAAPWLAFHWSFVTDTLGRYQIGATAGTAAGTDGPALHAGSLLNVARGLLAGLRPSMLTERISLYWRFFDPAYLFVSGGFTRLTNSTRHVAVFPLPFLALVPLGLIQLSTRRRTPASLVILLGFALAPVAACLTVLEPYASDRELVLLPFGVLIAAFGAERLLAVRTRSGRLAAIGLLALIPLHFVFFEIDYFGDYHRRAAFWFDWNHRGGLEEIIAREEHGDRPIFLSNGGDAQMAAFWRFAVLKHHREDLLRRTVYFDAKQLDISTVPRHALILMSRDDAALVALVESGALRELARVPEPADPPYYIVAER
jgi:4-amino-4-deoxy-L-arabinose transferase-like glycosyltransferase